jgi:hypothetical protein
MNDPDIWQAFASTPPPVEPVANKDNSLQGFQRRLLAQCGEDLDTAVGLLDRAYAILANVAVGLEPRGFGDLMVDIDDFREVLNGPRR